MRIAKIRDPWLELYSVVKISLERRHELYPHLYFRFASVGEGRLVGCVIPYICIKAWFGEMMTICYML